MWCGEMPHNFYITIILNTFLIPSSWVVKIIIIIKFLILKWLAGFLCTPYCSCVMQTQSSPQNAYEISIKLNFNLKPLSSNIFKPKQSKHIKKSSKFWFLFFVICCPTLISDRLWKVLLEWPRIVKRAFTLMVHGYIRARAESPSKDFGGIIFGKLWQLASTMLAPDQRRKVNI